MILTSQDQLKNLDNVGAVLIYPSKITTSGLIQSATSNDLVVNCIVDDDPDNAFIGQSLSQLGYPSGCYIAINYQNKKTAKEITDAFSSNLQLGYRAAIIVNKSDYTQDELKDLQQYGIVVIDHKDIKDSLLNVPNFLKTRSVAMMRDYTNVDISGVGPGAFVGVGKDTSGLGGGRSFGYSTNGQDFYAVITPKGLVFRQIDALRMWRLLKPQQAAQIGDFFNNKVAKEIEAQNESLKSAVATATSAVNAANQAVNDSKVNSDAIKAMQSAASEAKSDANVALQNAVADFNKEKSANQSAYAALHSSVASNQADITSASKAIDGISNSLNQFSASTNQRIDDAQKMIAQNQLSVDSTNKSLAGLATNLSKYAQDAVSQGKTIAELKQNQSDVSATVASVEGSVNQLKVDTSSVKATASDNKSDIANLQITASETSVALKNANSNIAVVSATASSVGAEVQNANSDISTLQATAKGLQGDVQDAKSNIASLQVSASNASVIMQNNKSDIASVSATADSLQAGLKSANGEITTLKGTASGLQADVKDNKSNIANLQISASSASVAIKDANSNVAVAVATASQASVELQDAKSNIAAVQATADGLQGTVANAQSDINQVKADAKGIHEQITNANSQIATINTNVNGLQTSVSQVTSSVNDVIKTAQANKTAIDQNTKAIALKANQTSVDDLNKAVSSQTASLTVMNNVISTKVSSADVEKAIDGKGYVTKDFVESSLTQNAKSLSESISSIDGKVQNITADVNGLQATVKNKADVSQITQLNNLISTKVNQNDYKSAITQLGDDINARVQKGDLISQINLEAGQTLIESKKLFLDADSVVFSGKAFIPDAAIAHLSLDKLTAGHITVPIADKYGNQIELGNDGINIISGLVVEDSTNSDSNSSDSNVSDTTTVSTDELTNLAVAPATALNTALFTISDQPDNPNPSSSASSGSSSDSSSASSSASSDSPDSNKIGYGVKLTSSGLKMYQHRQYVKTTGAEPKSEDFTLLDVNPIKSPASNDSKKLPEGLAFMIQTQKYSSVLGPETPHNFLALGRKYYNDANDYTGTDFYDVVYSAEDGNGYNVGLHVNTSLYTKPYGADHGIRTAWVSWSNWDGGQKYPAIVNDTANWGGIAFPSSGKATIFDASGNAFWPTQSYGFYNGYGG